jgi:hypothetical protein
MIRLPPSCCKPSSWEVSLWRHGAPSAAEVRLIRRLLLAYLVAMMSACQCGPSGKVRPEMTRGAFSGITEIMIGIRCQEIVK